MFLSSIQLDAFYAVAQTLHFSRAADRLHITQSALSQRILALESELGQTLFIRERAGVRLTEAALRLLRYCQNRQGLEEEVLADIESKGAEKLAGTIRIAGFSSVMRSVILPALAPVLRNHPNLHLEHLTRDVVSLPDLLKRGEVDFIVLDEDLKREGLEGFQIGFEENVLVRAAKRHRTAGPSAPSSAVFFDYHPGDPVTKNYFKLAERDFSKARRRYLDNVYDLIEGVRRDLGQAILPRHLIGDLTDVKIVNARTILKIPVFVHYYAQPFYTALHKAIVGELEKNAPALLK